VSDSAQHRHFRAAQHRLFWPVLTQDFACPVGGKGGVVEPTCLGFLSPHVVEQRCRPHDG
jgi:hypothetical protein